MEASRAVDVGDGQKMRDTEPLARWHLIGLLFDLYASHRNAPRPTGAIGRPHYSELPAISDLRKLLNRNRELPDGNAEFTNWRRRADLAESFGRRESD